MDVDTQPKKALALEVAVAVLVLGLLVYWGYIASMKGGSAPVARQAVTDVIDITGCKPTPQAASLPAAAGTRVTFKNSDRKQHAVYFGVDNKYVIQANSKKMVNLAFFKAPGSMSYDCDQMKDVGSISYKIQ